MKKENEFNIGDMVIAKWDVPIDARFGKILNCNKLNVIVEFEYDDGVLKKLHKFTLRKDNTYKPANWHWSCGVPTLTKAAT